MILSADRNTELPLESNFELQLQDRDQIKVLLWPIGRGICTGIDGDHEIQTSRLDELLAERYILMIRRAIDKLQPLRARILEIGFPAEIMERLPVKGITKLVGPSDHRRDERAYVGPVGHIICAGAELPELSAEHK